MLKTENKQVLPTLQCWNHINVKCTIFVRVNTKKTKETIWKDRPTKWEQ